MTALIKYTVAIHRRRRSLSLRPEIRNEHRLELPTRFWK